MVRKVRTGLEGMFAKIFKKKFQFLVRFTSHGNSSLTLFGNRRKVR